MDTFYVVTRDLENECECPWLDEPVAAGTIVMRFTGATYGAISDDGHPIAFERGGTFYEIPKDVLLQVSNASMKVWS